MTTRAAVDVDAEAGRYFYEPARGHGLAHDPFKAIVCPRPIGWISTRDRAGRSNIAPYSFFTAVCDAPPAIAFASDGWKDSARNVVETGEFACNFVSRDLIEMVNRSSIMHESGVSEFDEAAIPQAQCRTIRVPCVRFSPAVLECKLMNVVELKQHDGHPTEYKLVIGQVVGVQLDRRFLRGGLFDFARAYPVLRAGYRGDYVQIEPQNVFNMVRPPGSFL